MQSIPVPPSTSKRMASIKSKDTKIELLVRKILWRKGYRYRKNYPTTGKPDIVFVSKKVAIFLDGDFWHGNEFPTLKKKLKSVFWLKKIQNNMIRDEKVNDSLKNDGWKVLRFWESEINSNIDKVISIIETHVK